MSGRSKDIFDSANVHMLINSFDVRKFESCIAKFKLSLTTNLSIVANFGWIIWIDWPFC